VVGPDRAGGLAIAATDAAAGLPLAGVRVLDFSLLLPGPACTARLAWLGADVIKVEPPAGDPARDLYGGALWELANRGKRSVVLNLKEEHDRARLADLAVTADVVVESFRPGVAERLGFGYEHLRSLRADLVYCSITGYGDDPSGEAKPGHDLTFLAAAGALGAPGSWRARDDGPARPLVPVADLAAADAAVQSILAALLLAARGGGGRRLVISAFDATLHAVAVRAGPALRGAALPDPAEHLDPANDLYEAADGRFVAIAALEPHFWRALSVALGLGEALGPAPETWSLRDRQENGAAVAEAVGAACRAAPAHEVVERLAAAGVPVALVCTLEEAFASPELATRGTVRDGWVRPPLPFEGEVGPAPGLGEHTAELLGEAS
jgi:crotonobetainyl-CoA:carnitine CoA-transferase CaiB-like acyl-CoA transferase